MRLTDTEVKTFKDREVFVKVNENVRGQDVYVIQSTSAPANDHLMELLITMDALVRASARRITAVIPYFGYSPSGPGRPTAARRSPPSCVANLITTAGADRVVAVDRATPPRSKASSTSRPTTSLPSPKWPTTFSRSTAART